MWRRSRVGSGGFFVAVATSAACVSAGDTTSGVASLGEAGSGSTGGQAGVSSTITASASANTGAATTTGGSSVTSGATTSGIATQVPPQTDTAGDTTSGSTTSTPDVWNRYTFDVDAETWTRTPLDEVWTGRNAPPPFDLAAAVSLTHFDRLYVGGADGMFYERADGIWIEPVTLATRFPMAAGLDLAGMTHAPGQDSTTQEDVFLVDNPTAVIYTQHENGGLDFVQTAALADERGEAPQGSGRVLWYFVITDPALIGMDSDWLQWFVAYDDGNLWKFDAAFDWTQAPLGNNQFFSGAAGEPDPAQIAAAYYDDAFELAHFIGP